METVDSERRMEIIKKALQVAVVTLWAEYREDFEGEFSIEELQKCGEETATLAKNGLSVEGILHEALQEFANGTEEATASDVHVNTLVSDNTGVNTYRKKPVEAEAIKFDGSRKSAEKNL